MAVTAVAVAPSIVSEPVTITVSGLQAGQFYRIMRVVDNEERPLPDQPGANGAGVAVARDYLYSFGVPSVYRIYSAGDDPVLWATSNTITTPDALVPWIHDVVLPDVSMTPTIVVDVQSRVRGSRVSVFRVVGEKYPVTIGDIRQASEGDLLLFCPDKATRNQTINVMSTGGPCALRVPSACRAVVDDMFFTPLNITEERFGTNGACVLTVAFVEVDASQLITFEAITYEFQTYNADSVSLTYAGLSTNFLGLTYADLYLSANGINP